MEHSGEQNTEIVDRDARVCRPAQGSYPTTGQRRATKRQYTAAEKEDIGRAARQIGPRNNGCYRKGDTGKENGVEDQHEHRWVED